MKSSSTHTANLGCLWRHQRAVSRIMEHAYVRRIYLRGFASYVIMNFSTSLFKDVSAKNFYSTDFFDTFATVR